ncbi:MAG: hypothetical protein RHS_5444 [Robinsoniella sp. RHS]|nr:MAG: hypothetical protein RHS_5444 [Robinsoniella sp. RHS]
MAALSIKAGKNKILKPGILGWTYFLSYATLEYILYLLSGTCASQFVGDLFRMKGA